MHAAPPSTDLPILGRIRAGFAHVAARARHVRLDMDVLGSYADALVPVPSDQLFDTTHHYIGGAEDTACYVLCLDAINFGSGYKKFLLAEGWEFINHSIYFTVSTRLKDYFNLPGGADLDTLRRATIGDCRAILGLPHGPYADRFAELCAQSLSELTNRVFEKYNGSFLNLVRDADGAADRMVELLTDLPMFNDAHDYHGVRVPLHKRAQIAVADLQLALGQMGMKPFADVERLTMFPDNAVPHILRTDGVLIYEDDLAARIDAGALIESGSDAEIEIRACAGHAVELMAARTGLSAMNIDHILWHRSEDDPKYRASAPHRTLTHNY